MPLTTDTVRVTGRITHVNNFQPAIDIGQIAERALQEYAIDLATGRVHDGVGGLLPTAGATDDLGLVAGELATAAPSLQTEDLKTDGVTWNYARYRVILPPEYKAGEAVKIRVKGGMITTIADTTAFADIECYENEEDNTVSADLCTTAETTINTLIASPTTVDFTITASTLSPGSILDVRVGTEVTDAAEATAVIGCITKLALLCNTQG
jgi:acyl-coenzyme A thioesterase PaaI-like protein